MPDLSGLMAKLHPDAAARSPAAKGGTLRSGEAWRADDVIDVPHVAAPVRVDIAALNLVTRQASDSAASQFSTLDGPATWQPGAALVPRPVRDARLLDAWKPGAWTAVARQVMDAATEFITTPEGPVVQTYAAHWLLALWPPQRLDAPLLGRWPAQVLLSTAPQAELGDELLRHLPHDAPLWLAEQEVDWALLAELVLHHDTGLRPFQLEGLRAFAQARRDSAFARLNADYAQSEPGAPVQRKPAAKA